MRIESIGSPMGAEVANAGFIAWIRTLCFAVLHSNCLRRFAVAIALKVVSQDQFEEDREAPDAAMVDSFDLVAH